MPQNSALTPSRIALGVTLLVEGLLLFYLVVQVLPTALEAERPATGAVNVACRTAGTPVLVPSPTATPSPGATPTARDLPVRLFGDGICWTVSSDSAVLLLVIVVGALGATVHAARSFADHHSKGDFDDSYAWWYVLRPIIGAGLAVIFYFVIRGGLLSLTADDTTPNVYGITALAALAGLFSYPAMKRLEMLFARIGATRDGEGAETGRPVITGIEPATLAVGAEDRTITITGTGFGADPEVTLGGAARDWLSASPTTISMQLLEDDVAEPGDLEVVVTAGGTASEPAVLTVEGDD